MSEEKPAKPKLIVDEDWKSQVQAEKEAAKAPEAAAKPAPPPADQKKTAPQLPPASFPSLVTLLATQAMAALGQVPDASGKPSPPQLELARHFIDTLAMLEEKTKGNLTNEESAMLSAILHDLRMVFVEVKKA